MIKSNTRFLIIGLGLIGGSYAMGLKKNGYTIYGVDIDQDVIDYALENNIIDKGAVFDKDIISGADIVIFGLYPADMIDWIFNNQRFFKPGALITDVSGVKRGVVDVIQKDLRQDLEFLGAHPMAGKEQSKIQNSDDSIFFKANFIITPTKENTKAAIKTVERIAKILKFKNISVLSLKEHDEMVGFVSQLTHVIAVSLMNCKDNAHLKDYTGDSFRDLTRIAKINEIMWSELFFLNKDILISLIDDFVYEVDNLKKTLINNDQEALKKLMIESTKRREYFNK